MAYQVLESDVLAAAEKMGLAMTQVQAKQLADYSGLLLKWNNTYNLTSLKTPEEVLTLHLADSLTLVQQFDALVPGAKNVLDVGSGGGLPAIPLSIMRPDVSVSMIDAVQKKVIFLRQCIAVLRLKNAQALHGRIESFKLEPFDVVTSRAFASLKDMTDWSRHLLSEDGVWLAMKGKWPEDEIAELASDIEVVRSAKVSVPGADVERHMLVLQVKK